MQENKEQFKPEDIEIWKEKIEKLKKSNFKSDAILLDNQTSIEIPTQMFGKLINGISPNYNHLLPYQVKVEYYDGDPQYYWTRYTGYVGINNYDGTLNMFLKKDFDHSQLSLLWLLLHEFRHTIQLKTKSIRTNLYNDNFNKFMKYLKDKGNSENDINHVFHEILPYEIDANIFACEILNIEYPHSKFMITDYTIDLLK